MKKLYADLYESCFNKIADFNNLAHFVSMKGTNYDSQSSCRFLIVGRATNGWFSLPTDDVEAFSSEAERRFNTVGWNWVVEENGTLYNTMDDGSRGNYTLSSAFFTYSHAIFEKLTDRQNSLRWIDNIAWTNLYKIAPNEGVDMNPDANMRLLQKNTAIKIFKAEIDYYKPTHILFFTGWDWFSGLDDECSEFTSLFEITERDEKNIQNGPRKNNVYVEGTAKYFGDWGLAKAVITCRPDRRKKVLFIEEVLSAFNNDSNWR